MFLNLLKTSTVQTTQTTAGIHMISILHTQAHNSLLKLDNRYYICECSQMMLISVHTFTAALKIFKYLLI